MRLLLAALVLGALPLPAAEAPPAPLAPAVHDTLVLLRERALAGSRAIEHLRTLTDEVGPRLAGSTGDAAAVAWALKTMKALGLTNVHAEPVKVPHWERGAEEWGQVTAPARQKLVLAALGGSVATPPEGVEAEVVEADTLDGVTALGEKAKGKIVLLGRPAERSPEGSGYGKTVELRFSGPTRASKVGAVGFLLRSIATDNARLPHTGAIAPWEAGVTPIPAAALAVPDYELLHRLLAAGHEVRVRFRLSCRTLPDADSANVVGELTGREKPEEIAVLGAHLDSWDLGQGAVDDGAGCATILEAARLISTLPARPRRTLRVVLFANEENGARGSKAYPLAHAAELPRHVGALEADSGSGRFRRFSYKVGPGGEALLKALGPLLPDVVEPRAGGGGVDIGPLGAAGVPVFGINSDASAYFDIHHSADDTFDKVNPRDLDTDVAAATLLAYALAEIPETVPRPAVSNGPAGPSTF